MGVGAVDPAARHDLRRSATRTTRGRSVGRIHRGRKADRLDQTDRVSDLIRQLSRSAAAGARGMGRGRPNPRRRAEPNRKIVTNVQGEGFFCRRRKPNTWTVGISRSNRLRSFAWFACYSTVLLFTGTEHSGPCVTRQKLPKVDDGTRRDAEKTSHHKRSRMACIRVTGRDGISPTLREVMRRGCIALLLKLRRPARPQAWPV
jgi:hypothetical protein